MTILTILLAINAAISIYLYWIIRKVIKALGQMGKSSLDHSKAITLIGAKLVEYDKSKRSMRELEKAFYN